jgi:glycerate dehydrogenase
MKIVFLDSSTMILNDDVDLSPLRALGELVCHAGSSGDEVVERSGDAETVIVNKVKMTREVIKKLPALKHIAVIATGYNNVDVKAASKSGIRVTNVRGRDIKNGAWQKSSSFSLLTYPTFELAGRTIGIIGFGAIGRGVAEIACGFGMKVLVYDVADIGETEYQIASLDEIFTQADIVTLHCPLTDGNKYMINGDVLKKMKKSALLINTARGPLVDQTALAKALNGGEIAGAGIDVLDEEPPKDNPLLKDVKNLILSPHSAWSTREARQRLVDEVAENIKTYAEGRERNVVKG